MARNRSSMTNRLRSLVCCLMLVMAVGPPALWAGQNDGLSLEQAVAMVRRQTGGTILAAEPRNVNGKLMYRIKVLTKQQHVRNVWIDPGRNGKKR